VQCIFVSVHTGFATILVTKFLDFQRVLEFRFADKRQGFTVVEAGLEFLDPSASTS
jgi:light-regulated signal transduction histidine kinase (bacteriophytochrome)